jgi:DNA-3-methyladenine glycosylase I
MQLPDQGNNRYGAPEGRSGLRKIVTTKRCDWSTFGNDPLMLNYHDTEWGVPVHRDRTLFEFLTLEGAQAGLSWQTILNKRENYRRAFHGFDPAKIAKYEEKDVQRLLGNPGIVRNRLKIKAAITNAQKFLDIHVEFGSFDSYVWRFVDGRPIRHGIKSLAEIPSTTKESDALSKDLQQRGFKFVGSTICYSFMQAIGTVNDHATYSFRYKVTGGTGRHLRNDS